MKKKACGYGDTKLVKVDNTTTNKIALDAAYLATKVKFINQNHGVIPPFNAFELIEKIFSPEEDSTK